MKVKLMTAISYKAMEEKLNEKAEMIEEAGGYVLDIRLVSDGVNYTGMILHEERPAGFPEV